MSLSFLFNYVPAIQTCFMGRLTDPMRLEIRREHLPRLDNAALVASELGHSTSQLVYQHYRELVTPEQAERYWKIQPQTEAANVVAFTA